jgi:chromatin assembly factor 1 subunit B
MACEKTHVSVDSMEVDVGASNHKMEASPVALRVTVPPMSAENVTLSKRNKKWVITIAIN